MSSTLHKRDCTLHMMPLHSCDRLSDARTVKAAPVCGESRCASFSRQCTSDELLSCFAPGAARSDAAVIADVNARDVLAEKEAMLTLVHQQRFIRSLCHSVGHTVLALRQILGLGQESFNWCPLETQMVAAIRRTDQSLRPTLSVAYWCSRRNSKSIVLP